MIKTALIKDPRSNVSSDSEKQEIPSKEVQT
jgi:hypothetical protein